MPKALSGCERSLPAQRHLALPRVLDPGLFGSAAPLRRLFVMSPASQFCQDTGLLHLFFEQAQSELDIVVVDFDDQHDVTTAAARGALVAV